jgi:glycosyltransferase involved in cell wall biosynthesis
VAHVGAALSGLPHVVGNADVRVDHRGGSAAFAFDDEPMARLEVRLGRWARHQRVDLAFQAYSLLGGRVVRQRYVSVGDGYRGRRGEAELSFGEQRRAQRLARLDLSRRPLEVRALPRVNWISLPPEDLGAL